MRARAAVAALAVCGVLSSGVLVAKCNLAALLAVQQVVEIAGFVEPHTPGSGAPEERPTPAVVSQLLAGGGAVDLNRVTYVRTAVDEPPGTPPRAILLLIPGFLAGATTFDPLALQLAAVGNGALEVWAVDRRPNQLEDRLGGLHASSGASGGDLDAIAEGAQFYFADTDVDPPGDFPGPGDLDVDLDGVLDPQLPLTDSFGQTRGPLLLGQDDARFLAHWGVDAYVRDWKTLVDAARQIVGPEGLVLFGGHSQGTTWATTFAAYDFDPGPGVVAGHSLIDGLLLLEGGGVGSGSPTVSLSTGDVPRPGDPAAYEAIVAQLEAPGGPDVFLAGFFGIDLLDLGTIGEAASLAARFQPDEPSLVQRTAILNSGTLGAFLSAPATNEAIVGFFLDDDFSPVGAFRASMGFSDDGPNQNVLLSLQAQPGAGLRTWKDFDDPTLPSTFGMPPCTPLANFQVGTGCAILDNGPPSLPGNNPRVNGVETEVTALGDFARTQFGKANGFEWYFVAGRVSLDFAYGNDSSSLGDESLLAITQNASVDVPVLAIGGSNGLTPEAKSFDGYLGSIATPPADREVHVVEGYAHLDVINARDNAAVPLVVDWIARLLQRKLLGSL